MKITHDLLTAYGRRWLTRPLHSGTPAGHYGCPVVLTELSAMTATGEIPDVLGWDNRGSIVLECKTSVADFRADHRKPFRVQPQLGLGRQRWYLAPQGVIPVHELPDNWGLLELQASRLVVIHHSGLFTSYYPGEVAILLSTLRRLKIEPDGCVSLKMYSMETKNKASLTLNTE